jgi:hypothetical protein
MNVTSTRYPMTKIHPRLLFSNSSGNVYAAYRTFVFADAGHAILRLHSYAALACGEKRRGFGNPDMTVEEARSLYLSALVHMHGFLAAVPSIGRDYFFRRLLVAAKNGKAVHGLVGLLGTALGHFFTMGDTASCAEAQSILSREWDRKSYDANLSSFIVADYPNRLVSFVALAQIRFFLDCIVDLASDPQITRPPQFFSRPGMSVPGAEGGIFGFGPRPDFGGDSTPAGESPGLGGNPGLGGDPGFGGGFQPGGGSGDYPGLSYRSSVLGALVAAAGANEGFGRSLGDGIEVVPGVAGTSGPDGLAGPNAPGPRGGPNIYSLTGEDRQQMCVGITTIAGGIGGAIGGSPGGPAGVAGGIGIGMGAGNAIGSVICPLVFSTAEGEDSRGPASTPASSPSSNSEEEELQFGSAMMGSPDDVSGTPDILGIRAAKQRIGVGRGIAATFRRKGGCYEFFGWPGYLPPLQNTFLDEVRQQEIIRSAVGVRINPSPTLDGNPTAPKLTKEEARTKMKWRIDPPHD